MNQRKMMACVLVLLVACGEPTDSSAQNREPTREELEAVWEEVQPIIDEELAKEDARSAIRFPCTLYGRDAASALLHAEPATPGYVPGYVHEYKSHNDSSWQADACSWNSWDSGPSMNVWVSRPNQFADGQVQCFGMYEEETAQAHGGLSLWFFQGGFAWARLLVCRDDALFEIEIHNGPADEGEARDLTDRIARDVIGAL